MKKLLAIVLALVMVLSLFAGCAQQPANTTTAPKSNDDTTAAPVDNDTDETTAPAPADSDLEPVTLKWYYPGEELEGSADVLEVFNKKLADLLPNTTLEVVWVGNFDPYGEQWPLLLSGGEVMDIAWEGWNTPLQQDAIDGNVLPLTDLINEYAPNLVREMEIWQDDWASVTLDGEVYAIPSIQPSANMSTQFSVHESAYPYFDLEAILEEAHSSTKMTERFYDLVEEGIQACIDAGLVTVGDNSWYLGTWAMIELGTRGYVCLDKSDMGGALGNYFIDPEADTPTVLHYLEIPEVQMAVKRMVEWKAKGWITEAFYAEQEQEGATLLVSGNNTRQGTYSDLIDERGIKNATDDNGDKNYVVLLDKKGSLYKGVSSFGYATALAIPYTSENPERAIMLLNLLRDEVGTPGNELLNLLCYGFEANSEEAATYGWANYTATEVDGQLYVDPAIRNGADAKHTMVNWVVGNTFKTIHDGHTLTTREGKEVSLNFWTDVYPSMPECAITGMISDPTPVTDQLSAVDATLMEYRHRIRNGGGIDLLDECVDKMYAAGMTEIKTELQAQVDAYAG